MAPRIIINMGTKIQGGPAWEPPNPPSNSRGVSKSPPARGSPHEASGSFREGGPNIPRGCYPPKGGEPLLMSQHDTGGPYPSRGDLSQQMFAVNSPGISTGRLALACCFFVFLLRCLPAACLIRMQHCLSLRVLFFVCVEAGASVCVPVLCARFAYVDLWMLLWLLSRDASVIRLRHPHPLAMALHCCC